MKLPKWFLVASFAMLFAGAAAGAGGRNISLALLDRIHPGTTTEQQVLELLGPSGRPLDDPARGEHSWQYQANDYGDLLEIWITFGNDGIVRQVSRNIYRRGG